MSRFHTNYRGGPRKRYAKAYTSVCVKCGASIPHERWRKLTCDDTCERAWRSKRTREEQYWRDYSSDKITV